MYRMLLCGNNKTIETVSCSFCRHAIIRDCTLCKLHRTPNDQCERFATVEDVAERVKKLLHKLPDGYRFSRSSEAQA